MSGLEILAVLQNSLKWDNFGREAAEKIHLNETTLAAKRPKNHLNETTSAAKRPKNQKFCIFEKMPLKSPKFT